VRALLSFWFPILRKSGSTLTYPPPPPAPHKHILQHEAICKLGFDDSKQLKEGERDRLADRIKQHGSIGWVIAELPADMISKEMLKLTPTSLNALSYRYGLSVPCPCPACALHVSCMCPARALPVSCPCPAWVCYRNTNPPPPPSPSAVLWCGC